MKRRQFIKSIAGLFAATQVPSVLAKPKSVIEPFPEPTIKGNPDIGLVEIFESSKLSTSIFEISPKETPFIGVERELKFNQELVSTFEEIIGKRLS